MDLFFRIVLHVSFNDLLASISAFPDSIVDNESIDQAKERASWLGYTKGGDRFPSPFIVLMTDVTTKYSTMDSIPSLDRIPTMKGFLKHS